MRITRLWAMPSPSTFSVDVINAFVRRWMPPKCVAVDPFARDCDFAGPWTNDRVNGG